MNKSRNRHTNTVLYQLCWSVLLLIISHYTFAQYPQYFTHDNENNLPSNEVYSITQDNKGFIWLGCDAGLYKYNGVKYTVYKCATQKSKSITGLMLAASGTLYCYNFQGQLFFIDNDTLKELAHPFPNIINIVTDKTGNIFLSHIGGISSYNEITKEWKNHTYFDTKSILSTSLFAAKAARVNNKNELFFIHFNGVGRISAGQLQYYKNDYFKEISIGKFQLEYWENSLWIFSIDNNIVYRCINEKTEQIRNKKLHTILLNRKINNVRTLSDNNLWICTYRGIVQYNSLTDEAHLLYPELSFSDCMIDREGNYWFSTLQSGIIRVPDLNLVVWNADNKLLGNAKLTKVATDNTHIYFTTVNGIIGKLNPATYELKTFHTGNNADVQSLDYDFTTHRLYFNVNNHLFSLQNNHIHQTKHDIQAIKSLCKINQTYFIATSHGIYIKSEKKTQRLFTNWSREIRFDSINNQVWLATNKGLVQLKSQSDEWKVTNTFFSDMQILSIDFDNKTQQLYALTFDGKVYSVSATENIQYVSSLPENIQAYKLRLKSNKLFIATNNGLYIFNRDNNQWQNMNTLSGIASNNVQDLVILNEDIWLATGKGLQKVPPTEVTKKLLAKVYLKNISVEGNMFQSYTGLNIQYGQPLTLLPEASTYCSNGNFQYAYRIKDIDTNWNIFPASIEQISIPAIPSGAFNIELKAIDYLGRDSENTILINGSVRPPFWESGWFYTGIVIISIVIVLVVTRLIIRNIKQKAIIATELSNSKLTAIQAQMNPHFIFNSLNSIQDLILKGDVEHSYSYITTFSNLVRRTLNYSDKDFIDFDQEIKLLELYLSLEKLRFKKSLNYEIIIHNVEDIMLPPLLVQPFIENALVHGLLHKEGERELTITFALKNHLICTIEDNGIGREQAKAIRKRQRTEHESFSGEAIRKRFEILNETTNGKFGYYYEDLYQDNAPTGTRVTLTIPIKQKF